MSTLELIGALTGMTGIWLTLQRRVWCFPVGLVNVSLSMVLFYEQRLYADTLQQAVYIPLLLYGWIHWKSVPAADFRPGRLSGPGRIAILAIIVVSGWLLGFLLKNFTNADFPWADSLATATAFVAQYLIARKKIENWLLWMLVNLAYIVLYGYKELYAYMLLFFVYFLLAVLGYRAWKQLLPKTHETN